MTHRQWCTPYSSGSWKSKIRQPALQAGPSSELPTPLCVSTCGRREGPAFWGLFCKGTNSIYEGSILETPQNPTSRHQHSGHEVFTVWILGEHKHSDSGSHFTASLINPQSCNPWWPLVFPAALTSPGRMPAHVAGIHSKWCAGWLLATQAAQVHRRQGLFLFGETSCSQPTSSHSSPPFGFHKPDSDSSLLWACASGSQK